MSSHKAAKNAKDANDWALKRKEAIVKAIALREEQRSKQGGGVPNELDDSPQLRGVPRAAQQFQAKLQGRVGQPPPWAMYDETTQAPIPAPSKQPHVAVSPPWAVVENSASTVGLTSTEEEGQLTRTMKLWEMGKQDMQEALNGDRVVKGVVNDSGVPPQQLANAKRDLRELKARRVMQQGATQQDDENKPQRAASRAHRSGHSTPRLELGLQAARQQVMDRAVAAAEARAEAAKTEVLERAMLEAESMAEAAKQEVLQIEMAEVHKKQLKQKAREAAQKKPPGLLKPREKSREPVREQSREPGSAPEEEDLEAAFQNILREENDDDGPGWNDDTEVPTEIPPPKPFTKSGRNKMKASRKAPVVDDDELDAQKAEAKRKEDEASARVEAEMAEERAKREAHKRQKANAARQEAADRDRAERDAQKAADRDRAERDAQKAQRDAQKAQRDAQKAQAKKREDEASARVEAEMAEERAKREAHKRRAKEKVSRDAHPKSALDEHADAAAKHKESGGWNNDTVLPPERTTPRPVEQISKSMQARHDRIKKRSSDERAAERELETDNQPPLLSDRSLNSNRAGDQFEEDQPPSSRESNGRGLKPAAPSKLPSWARKAVASSEDAPEDARPSGTPPSSGSGRAPSQTKRRLSANADGAAAAATKQLREKSREKSRESVRPHQEAQAVDAANLALKERLRLEKMHAADAEQPEVISARAVGRRNSVVDRLRGDVNGGMVKTGSQLSINCDGFKSRPTSTPPASLRDLDMQKQAVGRPQSAQSSVSPHPLKALVMPAVDCSTAPPQSPAQRIRASLSGEVKGFSAVVAAVTEAVSDIPPSSPAQRIKASLLEKQQAQLDPAALLRPKGTVKDRAGKANQSTGDSKDPITRQMFDKRHSRRMNRDAFMAAISKWKPPTSQLHGRHVSAAARTVSLYVRKRPLFGYESSKGEFDVVSVTPPDTVVLHACQMHADMKRMNVKRTTFGFDQVFGEYAENDDVFEGTAKPLVHQVSDHNGLGTIFMFGQTGSGKTFTMEALHMSSVAHLFSLLPEGSTLVLSMFELAGKRILDLMDPKKPQLQIVDRGQKAVVDVEQAMALIAEANGRRATAGTDINAGSSRSHSVVELRAPGGGRLTMVDCAGTERKEDSMYHSSERRKEGAEINASLYALKECMRALRLQQQGGQAHVHVPYRSSNLTKVLMESFVRKDARIAVICTVSPASTDTEHSLATLRTASMLMGRDGGEPEETVPVEDVSAFGQVLAEKLKECRPHHWDHDSLVEWIQGLAGRLASGGAAVPKNIDGKGILRWPKQRFASLYNDHASLGVELYKELHAFVKKSAEKLQQQRKMQRKAVANRINC